METLYTRICIHEASVLNHGRDIDNREWDFSRFPSDTPGTCRDSPLKFGNCFLPHSFQFILYCGYRLHNLWHKYTTPFTTCFGLIGPSSGTLGFYIRLFSFCYSAHTGRCLYTGSALYVWSSYALCCEMYCLLDIENITELCLWMLKLGLGLRYIKC
jgi:hypothetical protein